MSSSSRKVITRSFKAEIGVQNPEKGRFIWVQSPFKLLQMDYNSHAFLRPFNRLLENGDPNIGRITYLMLKTDPDDFIRVLGSLVLSPGKKNAQRGPIGLRPSRLLFFPALGPGVLKNSYIQGKRKDFFLNVDHYTVEESISGKLSVHITFKKNNRHEKEHIIPSTPLRLSDGFAHHLATWVIKHPRVLDRAGLACGQFKMSNIKIDIEKILMDSLQPNHPMFELPESSQLLDHHFIRIDFLLSSLPKAIDREYPKPVINSLAFKEGPESIEGSYERIIPLPLSNSLTLLVILRVVKGMPIHDLTWFSSSKQINRKRK